MGLFSVLTASTKGEEALNASAPTNSGEIPTVMQLYAGQTPIQLDDTSKITGYSTMTYQAIQVGSSMEDEVKNRHQNPDLGIWNCRVTQGANKQALVDSLLEKVNKSVRVFCMAVDLTEPSQVEPTIALLQSALVRHLIESQTTEPPEIPTSETATTSLYALSVTDFGKANDDDKKESESKKNINDSFKAVKTTLMICVQMPPEDEAISMTDNQEAYRKKQAQSLVIYHLRKFAAALNCSLCFVQLPPKDEPQQMLPSTPSKDALSPAKASPEISTNPPPAPPSSTQPTVSFDKLTEWWRDLALKKKIWDSAVVEPTNEEDTPENVVIASPLYGPGKHNEELIESVLLRTAQYPGHWDASKDSLWVALPFNAELPTEENTVGGGDQNWLGQLRNSMAVATEKPPPAATPERPAEEEKPKKKEENPNDVSDFFASLLKQP